MIGGWDCNGGGDFVERLSEAAKELRLGEVFVGGGSLHGCDIAVIHVGERRPDDKQWMELRSRARAGSVWIRVSSVGFPRGPLPSVGENDVLQLHLAISSRKLATAEWKEILSGLRNPRERAALGSGSASSKLRLYFAVDNDCVATTLLLLSEGYLAVRSMQSVAESEPDDVVKKALGDMGWLTLPEEARSSLRGNVRQRCAEVSSPDWWKGPLVAACSDCGEDAAGPLRLTRAVGNVLQKRGFAGTPKSLEKLLSCVELGSPVDEPGLVAQVYVDLVDGMKKR